MNYPEKDLIKQVIFTELGITQTAPWEGVPAAEMMKTLRQASGNTLEEVAAGLGLSYTKARHIETAGSPEETRTLLAAIKPKLEERARDGWLARGSLSGGDDVVKQKIFKAIDITDTSIWADKPIAEILTGLRENAGYTLQELGEKLGVNRQRVDQLETGEKPEHIERLLDVLAPRLKQLANQGWLARDSLAVDKAHVSKVMYAGAYLEKTKGYSWRSPSYGSGLTGSLMKATDLVDFLSHVQVMSLGRVVAATEKLCAHYDVQTSHELIRKAKSVAKMGPEQHYAQERWRIGSALGAMLEFAHLNQKTLMTKGVFYNQPMVASFIEGDWHMKSERVERIPNALMNAYQQKYPGQEVPEEIKCETVGEMTRKGLRLAALSKDYLRAGISRLLQEEKMTEHALAEKSGVAYGTISAFLGSRSTQKNLPTHYIEKLLKPLGVSDIFALEAMGKAVYEQSTGPLGEGADARGKPLPAPPTGGYVVLETLRRLEKKDAFRAHE